MAAHRLLWLLAAALVGACAHAGGASEPSAPPTIVDTGTEYLFEFVPPPGWMIPDAPAPSGAVRVTVGGQLPSEAPASLMVRAVSRDGATFDEFCSAELGSMASSFPGEALVDVPDVTVPGKHSVTKQINGPHRTAIVTLLDEGNHFMWFGMMVNDPAYVPTALPLYRESVRTYKRSFPPGHTADSEVAEEQ